MVQLVAGQGAFYKRIYMNTTGPVRVIILSAGKGIRMNSKLPKTLVKVHGKPMITHIYEKVLKLNPEKIIIVVGHKKQMVMDAVGDGASYTVQDPQMGTGHAVLCAREQIRDFDGNVVVLNGDMPFIKTGTVSRLIHKREEANAAAALVSAVMVNPPDCGRIIRDQNGSIKKIVEARDATPDQLKIKEISVGTYCFDCRSLLDALMKLSNNNSRAEYYLTEVIEILSLRGHKIVDYPVRDIGEILNINSSRDLRLFETLKDV